MATESTHRRLFLHLLAGFAIVIGALFLPVFGSVSKKGVQTRNLSSGKQVATACRLYAGDHDGKFPAHLSELEPDYVSLKNVGSMIILNPNKDSGLRSEWLYFGAGFTEDNPPTILLADPQVDDRENRRSRISFSGDTSGRIGPESEYQSALAKTMQETQERFAPAGPKARPPR